MKPVIVILTVVSVGLGVAMLVQHTRSSTELKAVTEDRARFSNNWQEASVKLEELQKVAANMESTLAQRTEALVTSSNELARANSDLTRAQGDIKTAQVDLQKQTARVAELETQRDDLTRKMDELTASIKSLETRIDDTKKKLATSEGDRKFLLTELKRLQDEKSVLVAQFNDLSALRAQVAKLKEEAAINQRIAWIKAGVYNQREKKGAERLLAGPNQVDTSPDNRLQIELEQNGAGRVTPNSSGTPSRP